MTRSPLSTLALALAAPLLFAGGYWLAERNLSRSPEPRPVQAATPSPYPTANPTQRTQAWQNHTATLEARGGGVYRMEAGE